MLSEYSSKKANLLGVSPNKKQMKQIKTLENSFKKQLKEMVKHQGVKTKTKRKIGTEQQKTLKQRGEVMKLLMKKKGLPLGEASKKISKLYKQGVSYNDMLKSLN